MILDSTKIEKYWFYDMRSLFIKVKKRYFRGRIWKKKQRNFCLSGFTPVTWSRIKFYYLITDKKYLSLDFKVISIYIINFGWIVKYYFQIMSETHIIQINPYFDITFLIFFMLWNISFFFIYNVVLCYYMCLCGSNEK